MTPPPLDDLLAQQGFLRRLAASLVADPATADDLVQETFLLALDRPPERPGALRAWLATCMRRLAGRGRRGAERRGRRERAGARDERTGGGLDELDRRLDAQLLVAELLRGLPDAQREALLLRYLEERSPSEIAAALDVSVDTVKTRLRRGLEALRSELDRRHGGRREVWALALVPGVGRVGKGAALAPAAPLAGKGVAMALGWKAATAGAAVVVAAAAAVLWSPWRGAEPAREEPASEPSSALAAAPESEGVEEPSVVAPDLEPAPAVKRSVESAPAPPVAETAPEWPLRLVLVGPGSDEHPRAAARVYGSTGFREERVVTAEVAVPGEALLDVASIVDVQQRPEDLVIEVSHPTLYAAPVRVHLGRSAQPLAPPEQPWEARVELAPGAVVVGRVTGEGAGGALVIAYPLEAGAPLVERAHSTEAGGDGAFRLVLPAGGEQCVVALAPERRPACARVVASLGGTVDAGKLALERGAVLAGVMLRAGEPVGADGAVWCSPHPLEAQHMPQGAAWIRTEQLGWRGGAFEWSGRLAETDEEGRFEFSGLAPLEHSIGIGRPPAALGQSLPGASAGRIVRAPDEALELACDSPVLRLNLDPGREADLRGELVVKHAQYMDWRVPVRTWKPARDHELLLYAPPDAELELVPVIEGFDADPITLRTPAGPELVNVDVQLFAAPEPARLTIALTGDLPPEGTRFRIHVVDPAASSERTTGAAHDTFVREEFLRDGRLELGEVPSDPIRVRLYPSTTLERRASLLLDVELELDLLPGEEREVEAALELGGTLRLVALDADGQPAAAACTVEAPDGRELDVRFFVDLPGSSRVSPNWLHAEGPSQLDRNLAPGRYRLHFRLQGHRELVREVEVLAGETTDLTAQLERE